MALAYVPITLTNNQSTSTGTGFQQLLQNIDMRSYEPFLNSDLSNVYFSSDSAGSTVIDSWLESGNTSTSAATTFWVVTSVAANSTTTVYMQVDLSGANHFNTTTTGEAPQLSSTYGQYDNGASVFPTLYENFAGTAVPSGWTASSSPPPDMDNGLILSNTCEYLHTNSNYGLNAGQILEFYGTYPTPTGAANTGMGYGYSIIWDINTNGNTQNVFSNPGGITAPPSTSVWGIYWPLTSSASFYNNYILLGTTTSGLPTTTLPIEGSMQCAAGQAVTGPFYWVRIRAYPPNGEMPAVSIGQPQNFPYINTSTSPVEVLD